MGSFFKAVKAGVNAALVNEGPQRYHVGGNMLRCPVCQNDRFARGKAQLHTAGMTFIGLDWAQSEAATLACIQCSRVEWFLDLPDVAE